MNKYHWDDDFIYEFSVDFVITNKQLEMLQFMNEDEPMTNAEIDLKCGYSQNAYNLRRKGLMFKKFPKGSLVGDWHLTKLGREVLRHFKLDEYLSYFDFNEFKKKTDLDVRELELQIMEDEITKKLELEEIEETHPELNTWRP